VHDDEIGGAFDIQTLSLKRHSSGSTSAPTWLYDFQIYAGLTDQETLGSTFDTNFIPGTRTLVFSRDSLFIEVEPNAWIDIVLDDSFWYEGDHNLVLEILWSAGEETGTECAYTWHWNTGQMRCLSGYYNASSGSLTSVIPHMVLTGTTGLDQSTFAAIKTYF
jgi:hypothetical protein